MSTKQKEFVDIIPKFDLFLPLDEARLQKMAAATDNACILHNNTPTASAELKYHYSIVLQYKTLVLWKLIFCAIKFKSTHIT